MATAGEMRTAFRKAARQLHPDTNEDPQSHEDFQRLKAAYEVLRDAHLRSLYDRLGISALGARYVQLGEYLRTGGRTEPPADEGPAESEAAGEAPSSQEARLKRMQETGRLNNFQSVRRRATDSWAWPGRADCPGHPARRGRVRRGEAAHVRGHGRLLGLRGGEAHAFSWPPAAAAQLDPAFARAQARTLVRLCHPRAQGSGCGALPPPCSVCRGSGQILRSERIGLRSAEVSHSSQLADLAGLKLTSLAECPACAGQGVPPADPCLRCDAACQQPFSALLASEAGRV